MNKEIKKCFYCQKDLVFEKNKFCGKECYHKSRFKKNKNDLLLDCTICKELKPRYEFSSMPSSTRGRHSWCNKCMRKKRMNSRIFIECNCKICNSSIKIIKNKRKDISNIICRKCTTRKYFETTGKRTPNFTGNEYFTGKEYAQWFSSAKRRNIGWFLSKDILQNIIKKQNYICNLSGLTMETFSNSPYRISLDRINSDLDYTEDNVKFICSIVNVMKNKLLEKDFINICKKIVDFNKK